jgi:hypothetical protein
MSPDRIHGWLDDGLDADALAAFAGDLDRDPALRRALARAALDDILVAEAVREGLARPQSARRVALRPLLAAASILLAVLTAFLLRPPADPAPSRLLDDAVLRGIAFLRTRGGDLLRPIRDGGRHAPAPTRSYAELGLLALLEAGVDPRRDDLGAALLDHVLAAPPASTYTAALQAVVLSRIDAAAHRDRLRACARWLCDQQALNGQWDYGGSPRPPSGDNSCSSYAALGLRACVAAGVEVDAAVLRRARDWWLQSQDRSGGWGYHDSGRLPAEASPDPENTSSAPYGSMTASAVASILSLSEALGEDARKHPAVRRGIEWLRAHPFVDRNPGKGPGFAPLHHLLALQRAARLSGEPALAAGLAPKLLLLQHESGAWRLERGPFMKNEIADVLDTCLAVILLRRTASEPSR